jgi:hypothetical protein
MRVVIRVPWKRPSDFPRSTQAAPVRAPPSPTFPLPDQILQPSRQQSLESSEEGSNSIEDVGSSVDMNKVLL